VAKQTNTMLIQVIAKNVGDPLFGTQCICSY